jgi:hypothetical protein
MGHAGRLGLLYRFPNHRAIRRAQDGAPRILGLVGEDKCNSGSLRDDKQKGGNGARGWLELDAVLADDGEDGQEVGEGEEFLDSFAKVGELDLAAGGLG